MLLVAKVKMTYYFYIFQVHFNEKIIAIILLGNNIAQISTEY